MPIGRKSGSDTAHRCLGASFHVMLVGAVLTVVGCTVGPHYKNPVLKVNDSWNVNSPQISAQPVADSAWWKSFNDPTLEKLIQLAYNQNLPLQVAGLRIMEARAVLGVSVGNQYPQGQISA
ncbi:MAG TPA: hypothetical protein VN647_05730, partial [Nitrospira sp.]|nr:hypothetical protein [Nitrospira sp.]